jgi:EAL domain-containing protein (putative c-di-GMP-specific phosphodiesterase class I)
MAGVKCEGCREDIALPFEFKMAFQPIVDVTARRVWGYELWCAGPTANPRIRF